jgi:hypothetical protein
LKRRSERAKSRLPPSPLLPQLGDLNPPITIRLLRVETETKRFKEPRGFRIANRTRCTESKHQPERAAGSNFHINTGER